MHFYSELSLPIETQGVLTTLDQLKLIAPPSMVAGRPTQQQG